MRFSSFLTARSLEPGDDRRLIHALTEHATACHRYGFDAVFLPDHHFTGYCPPASDPMIFGAYLASRLPGMHLGFSVQTVALHHPVRFAERVALLDQLTDGRLLVGVGSGTTPEEMIGFGVKFQESSTLSVQNIEIAERLWAKQPDDEPVIFDNGRYQGAVVSRIVPTPYSKPMSRLMSVAQRPSSVERAATYAQPAFIPAFTVPVLDDGDPYTHVKKHFTNYRTALEAAGHSEEAVAAALDWTTHTYQHIHVAESDAQAEDELQIIMDGYMDAIEREHEANKAAETISGVDLRPHPPARGKGNGWQGTWCLWGSPDTVAEKLQKYADLGIGNILGGFLGGPLTPERAALGEKSLKLFAEQVMPRFAR
ncbi:LLM class flavin-dependent oxidoreductase [Cryptosporangium japonicum]|uniref:LLM class flavin-dependent oxidoreductase n=1 Tax=Cryptosporangium japonicum TaxID=80872 RepID=A0ABN0UF78_9ACTN